ncbi:hypothetical protein PHYBOEH_007793 [Phytophthora boehmeriae]|uniref:Uncharacterized protein n=1 Tax=Phytophthora boehmeriae TaxID=109152 RepID=A0A8T1W8X3_9STRA|nr:hypothetical protein PHYBOEH_007793 [Phytophthora boehmeriae]
MAAISSALQVADLFDAQAAEAPIHRLVSVLNAQASQIREMQERIEQLQAAQTETIADCKALQATVSPLGGRIDRVEDNVTTLCTSQSATEQQLTAIERQLGTKADRQELQDVDIVAKTSLEHLGENLRNELASLPLVQCLQTEQSELHERLETVDRRLGAKMDKAESARLDGVLVQIHGFRPMVMELSAQVAKVQTQQQDLERSVARIDSESVSHRSALERLQQHGDDLHEMVEDIEDRHHGAMVPQYQRLDRQVAQLQRSLDELQTAATTSEATLRTLSAKLQSSAGAFTTQLQQQYRHFERALAEKAPRLEVKAEFFDVNRQIAAKVSNEEHRSLSLSVDALQSQCEKLLHHVKLSTRFVDWFARRGEAYEHNLELVETQLGRLAMTSHPQDREPFGERVRFPRSP